MVRRQPRGYLGIQHETIGSDILALHRAMLMPEQVLGPELAARISRMQETLWYPIDEILEPLELIAAKLGAAGLRKVGRTLFAMSHEIHAREVLKSARDIAFGLDRMYKTNNRGREIGSWTVLSFVPGECQIEKTTPHHCALEEGIVRSAMQMVGLPVNIAQPRCMQHGDDHCLFAISSVVVDRRWTGD